MKPEDQEQRQHESYCFNWQTMRYDDPCECMDELKAGNLESTAQDMKRWAGIGDGNPILRDGIIGKKDGDRKY